ncbi:hypothetical protein D0X99_07275 [Algoriphagus lacus]|uniref:Uncharacterized protein n=1 Tax=Algoriphagus lacus TaxID=2056311 RepID=A0A418PST1_9BACT|nr:DUF6266 family protein [Algoriphagus lacus]RIW16163.1 hypothetical protein D0X99_07275 [Algoriphagus lacus]
MAKLPNTSLILPKGKIGNLVFYTLNGQTVVRKRPSENKKNKEHPSPLQLIQREKLQTINSFLRPIKQVLDFGYQEVITQSKKGIHWAYSELNTKGYNHTREPKIDPAFLRISKGNLLGPLAAELHRIGNRIQITWEDNSREGKARAEDESFILLYSVENQQYIWMKKKFQRKSGLAELDLNSEQAQRNWHVYLAFSQINLKKKSYQLSDSVYLGKV